MSRTSLPQAVIVSGSYGEDLGSYYEEHREPADELLQIDEHPNASKTNTGIYIEDIRALQQDVRAAKKHIRTVVVLRDAAAMTAQSQNALLKLLEEPRLGLHFILQTHTPTALLDTIRSRCQEVTIHTNTHLELPSDKAARIQFMAGGVDAEAARLLRDEKYFMRRTRLFELAKRYVGGSAYDRLVVVKQAGGKRDEQLEFIDACLVMYTALLCAKFTPLLRDEAARLMAAEEAIKQNGNTKLQMLRAVI